MVDFLKSLLSDFDPAALVPDLAGMFQGLEGLLRIAVMVGPLCLLGLGLFYLLLPPKEANYNFGYRAFWAMSSVDAWQFTHKVAGVTWTALGLVLTTVMGLRCNGFRDLGPEEMVWAALWSLVWELGIIAVSILAVNIAVMVLFDHKGNRRK